MGPFRTIATKAAAINWSFYAATNADGSINIWHRARRFIEVCDADIASDQALSL